MMPGGTAAPVAAKCMNVCDSTKIRFLYPLPASFVRPPRKPATGAQLFD